MSYDLNIYLKEFANDCIEPWIEGLKKYGLECEIHPEFSVKNQSGFLPFKVKILREDIPCRNTWLLSGFELNINDYVHCTSEENVPFWKNIFKKKSDNEPEGDKILKENKKELSLYISSQDSLEFILAWYSAGILTKLGEGVLFDPQEGLYYNKNNVIQTSDTIVSEYIKSLPSNSWNMHQFEKWL